MQSGNTFFIWYNCAFIRTYNVISQFVNSNFCFRKWKFVRSRDDFTLPSTG
jgi:hypothetical protein